MFYILIYIVFVYIYTCCIMQLLKHACYILYFFDDNFFFFWLYWVFIAASRLSLVVVCRLLPLSVGWTE